MLESKQIVILMLLDVILIKIGVNFSNSWFEIHHLIEWLIGW